MIDCTKRFWAAFVVLLIALIALPVNALADVSYYESWSAYQAENDGTPTWNVIADEMDKCLEHGREAFQAGDLDEAYKAVNYAYYGWYETTGFERTVMGYIGNGRVSEVELQFSAAKAVAKKEGSFEDYDAECTKLSELIHTDANKLDGVTDDGSSDSSGAAGAAATFAACFSIILREGFEAILIVGAIIAYLNKTNNQSGLRAVYLGSILGIVASFIAAWLLNELKLANAAPQEIIEGVTALIAVCVLFYVSNWMFSKSESEVWQNYIEGQVEESVDSGSSFTLAFTAWLAVFREGAEVVLFYQPMLAGDNINMVWAGFGVGCVALVFVYLAIRFAGLRLPIGPFFLATSILMAAMSISFLGGGIKELIEGDLITMTPISWIPSNEVLEVLGIYPCVETIVPQLILLVITIATFVISSRRNKAQKQGTAAA